MSIVSNVLEGDGFEAPKRGVLWLSRGHFYQEKLSLLEKTYPDTMSSWGWRSVQFSSVQSLSHVRLFATP